MSSELAIRAEGIGKRYRLGATQGVARYRSLREEVAGLVSKRNGGAATKEFWALKDVSFEIRAGETVGIIGRNGAGKSTMLKVLARITPPTTGRGVTTGRVGSLLEVGTGFHPELTGRENIMLSAAVMGMRRSEVLSRFDEIVEFSGLARFLDTPVKRYSSGMYMRLAFSVAAHLEPEILLVDEVLAVGDADFQKKCLGRMEDLGGSGRTVLFVSHSMPSILRLCPRVILLDGGRLEADGPAAASVEAYFNSGAAAGAERRWNRLEEAPGDEIVRLKSVRVVGEVGETTAEIDIRRPVGIEVEHWNVGVGSGVRPATFLRFFNQEGVQLFSTANFHSPDWEEVSSRSDVVRSTCWIPGNFLAEGRVTVLAGLVSLDPKVVHAREPDAVAFHVFDRSVGDGVRGHFPTDWEGVVRPWLDWIVVPGSRSFGDDDGLPTDPAVEPLVRPLAHGHRRQP